MNDYCPQAHSCTFIETPNCQRWGSNSLPHSKELVLDLASQRGQWEGTGVFHYQCAQEIYTYSHLMLLVTAEHTSKISGWIWKLVADGWYSPHLFANFQYMTNATQATTLT